jgi:hypothetical protein
MYATGFEKAEALRSSALTLSRDKRACGPSSEPSTRTETGSRPSLRGASGASPPLSTQPMRSREELVRATPATRRTPRGARPHTPRNAGAQSWRGARPCAAPALARRPPLRGARPCAAPAPRGPCLRATPAPAWAAQYIRTHVRTKGRQRCNRRDPAESRRSAHGRQFLSTDCPPSLLRRSTGPPAHPSRNSDRNLDMVVAPDGIPQYVVFWGLDWA